MSFAGLWNRSVNSLKSTRPSWFASTHIITYSISSLVYNFCISRARLSSFGVMMPSLFVSHSWNASDDVKSFIFRKMSKNFRIISKLADDSTRVSTICFPIGPLTTLPASMDSSMIIISFCSFMNSRSKSSCSGS
ncbi:hypothetical protein NP493_449g00001 [Ridgeia piscesae]|uniref:Uncharacterized protein n=1 Tax=Ridgeia piscesae TaxID=27915 RepID=A0AAD9KZN3_RIDPI|nr:hypothetical protein NP493_449g00001 [Ridgeia piscesae]